MSTDQRASELAKVILAACQNDDDYRTIYVLSTLLKDAARNQQTQRVLAPKTRLAELIYEGLKVAE